MYADETAMKTEVDKRIDMMARFVDLERSADDTAARSAEINEKLMAVRLERDNCRDELLKMLSADQPKIQLGGLR